MKTATGFELRTQLQSSESRQFTRGFMDVRVLCPCIRISKKILHLTLFCMFFGMFSYAFARNIQPVVSTDWLEQNLNRPEITVLDIRTPARYAKGHIPGSINVPASLWAVSQNELSLELPPDETLRDLLGKSGINRSRAVVVVTHMETDFSRADALRVAWTLILAGVENAAALDGGIDKWTREKKPLSTEATIVPPVVYDGTISRNSLATQKQVLGRPTSVLLVDTRTPEEYFGILSPEGHILGAGLAPAPWLYTSNGSFIPQPVIKGIAEGVFGTDKSREIIVYCGVGGYAAAWWFVLTQILDYQNVKVYDGSMEEWIKDANLPVEAYRWN